MSGKINHDSSIASRTDALASSDGTVVIARLLEERDAAQQDAAAAHEQLRKSEELLIGLLSTALDGICLLENRKVYFVNPRLCEMLSCSEDVLLGQEFSKYVVPDDLVRTQQMYRRMMRSEAFPQRYETVLISPGGHRVDVGIHADRIDLHGRFSILLRIRDISTHRQVRQMAVENERLEAVLNVANSVGSNFANALSVIRTHAATITDSFLPNSRPHEAGRQVLEAAEHAAELTKRLLSVVRMSGSDNSVHIEPVSLGVSLRKAHELLSADLDERSVRLVIPLDPRPWYVLADAGQLLDVLMNIFLNSADAMPQGGAIEVRIGQERRELAGADGCVNLQDLVVLEIKDTGEGMTPEQMSRVFEPFYTTKHSKHAYGLGLPVAKQMLNRWGGEIEMTSESGVGTTACLLLPKARDSEMPQGEVAPGETQDRMILVVEDHPARRRMMVDVLRESGFTVFDVDSGEKAIAFYHEHRDQIALTVLDWMLPGTDGGVVLQSIQDYDPDARVLLVSGFSKDYVRSQVKRGAWAFLQKPFSADDLRAAVQRTLPAPRC